MKVFLLVLMISYLKSEKSKKVLHENFVDLNQALQDHHRVIKWNHKGAQANHIVFSLEKTSIITKGLVIALTGNRPLMGMDILNTNLKGTKINTYSIDGNIIIHLDPETLTKKLGVESDKDVLKIQP